MPIEPFGEALLRAGKAREGVIEQGICEAIHIALGLSFLTQDLESVGDDDLILVTERILHLRIVEMWLLLLLLLLFKLFWLIDIVQSFHNRLHEYVIAEDGAEKETNGEHCLVETAYIR